MLNSLAESRRQFRRDLTEWIQVKTHTTMENPSSSTRTIPQKDPLQRTAIILRRTETMCPVAAATVTDPGRCVVTARSWAAEAEAGRPAESSVLATAEGHERASRSTVAQLTEPIITQVLVPWMWTALNAAQLLMSVVAALVSCSIATPPPVMMTLLLDPTHVAVAAV